MIKSMTAYGRASQSSPLGRFVVEVHSVNRKLLDLSIYLPKDLLRFDIDVRKWLGAELERGQVTVRVALLSEGMGGKVFSALAQQLKGLKAGWEQIAHELGMDPKQSIDLPFLVGQVQTGVALERPEEEAELKGVLERAVKDALADLMQMKVAEGKLLVADIQHRIKLIEENLAAIELKRDEPLHRYRKKLLERLREVGQMSSEFEERVAREVALMAERMDVTEEVVRLRSHIQHFRQHLFSQEKSIGRTLDFLTQEMLREINTLGAKSSETEVSVFVVTMKSELEKIREQVQNIE